MEHRVYLIMTPLQLINAIEAKNHFKTESPARNILFIFNLKYKTEKQIERILDYNEWDHVEYLLKRKRADISLVERFFYHALIPFREAMAIRNVKRSLNRLPEHGVDTLFLGNYLNRISYRLAQEYNCNKILLDDGAGTIEVLKLRQLELKSSIPLLFERESTIIKKAGLAITGISRKKIPDNVSFFSCFLEENPENGIIRNDFKYFSRLSENKALEPVAYFVGSPLVELGILQAEEYVDALMKFKEYYANKGLNLIYILHRLERSEKIDLIRRILTVKSFDVPIEAELLNSEILPEVLASFYSAALLTCHLLFKNRIEINAFRINSLNYKKVTEDNLVEIYAYYSNLNSNRFRVLDIPA